MPDPKVIAIPTVYNDTAAPHVTRSLATEAIAGIVVGAVCGLIVLLVLLWLKQRYRKGACTGADLHQSVDEKVNIGAHGESQVVSSEFVGCGVIYELSAKHGHSELRQVADPVHELPPGGVKRWQYLSVCVAWAGHSSLGWLSLSFPLHVGRHCRPRLPPSPPTQPGAQPQNSKASLQSSHTCQRTRRRDANGAQTEAITASQQTTNRVQTRTTTKPARFGSTLLRLLVAPCDRNFSVHEDLIRGRSTFFKQRFQAVRKAISGDCAVCLQEL